MSFRDEGTCRDLGGISSNGSLAERRRDEHNQDRGHRADRGRHPGSGVRQVQLHQGGPRGQAGRARGVVQGKGDGQRSCLGRPGGDSSRRGSASCRKKELRRREMKRVLLAVLLGVFLLVWCVVAPGHRGSGVVLVPALPSIVVLEEEPYYHHSGYHYHYQDDRWFYSNSRSGPWVELPRDRYPKEVKFKGKGQGRDRDDDRGRGEKRGHDERRD